MRFNLIDAVLEQSAERIVTLKQVSAAEEYLGDHFPGFPVLPGVMMLEAMVQAGRRLVEGGGGLPAGTRLVLGGVRALKYGRFVRPGEGLVVEVSLAKGPAAGEGCVFDLRGEGRVMKAGGGMHEGAAAVSGRFVLRPVVTVASVKVGE
jgi:3-hydroxyacyl-[acyl-carrier-protein] dehydratase